MRRVGIVLGIALLALGVFLYWLSRPDSEPAAPSRGPSVADDSDSNLQPLAQGIDATATGDVGDPTASQRRPTAGPTLEGLVLDATRTPIEGALVTWSALTETHFESPYAWDVIERNGSSGVRVAASDNAGRFEFTEPPLGARDGHSVLWVTRPGFRAAAQLLDLDAPLPSTPLEFVLETGPEIHVRVVDGGGRPMPGVRVEQIGIRTPPARLASPIWGAAHRAFLREAVTDAEGRWPEALSEFPATYTLIARAGAQRSQPWFSSIDGPAQDVELRMGPQVQAGGSVRWPTGIELPGRALVTVSGVTNAYQLVLGQARVADDGTWGPLEVPLFGAVAYVFRLEAEGCGVEQHTLPAPEAGAVLRVDFAPQPGFDLPLEVVDAEGAPVVGAALLLTTGVGGDALFLQGHTDGAGRGTLRGVPPGFANLDVSASDHPPGRVEGIAIGPTPPELLRVTLGASAGLRGRVTHAGEPVEDFEIAWWTQALFSGQPPTVERFQSADGAFELAGLPRSRVSLLAVSNEHPRSEALTVDLSVGGALEVAIDLPAPIAASGRVVDAFSGAAVPGAVVQQFTNAGPAFVHAWGAPAVARADGSFELPGLAPGDNRLTIQAAGYADRLVSIFAPDTTQLDLGPVPLFRGMRVVLVLSADDPRGSDGLRASLVAARHHPPQPFESDGTSVFDAVTPGRVVVNLVRNDGSTESEILDLPPAEEHVLEVGGGGDARLELAVPEEALATLADPWIALRDRARHGLRTQSAFLSAEGRVEFRCRRGGSYSATLWSRGRPLATRSLEVTELDQRVVLDVTPLEATLEVVDARGAAVPFAEVHLYDESGWTHAATADADGRATLAGLPPAALAGATSPTHGMRFDVAVEPGPPSRPTRIELRPDAALHVELTTAEGPAAGIQVRAMAAADTYLVGYATTDDDGRATFANLAEGEYTVHVEHPGLFRQSVPAATGTRANPTRLRVHPLGGLQLTVRAADGTPLAGAEVDLEHPELPGSLRSWIAEGRVRLAGEPRTDGQGRVRIDELPAGPVRWSVVDGPHAGVQGTALVIAGRLTEGD